jgi:hypothetical protein
VLKPLVTSRSATCDNSQSQSFVYNNGSTSIQVNGTDLCVEFGPGLGRSGTPLRVQTCRSNGAPDQRLIITDDNHVALQNGPGQCADVRNAEGPLQSWGCASDNTNQVSTEFHRVTRGVSHSHTAFFRSSSLEGLPSPFQGSFKTRMDSACKRKSWSRGNSTRWYCESPAESCWSSSTTVRC